MNPVAPADIPSHIGRETGISDWLTVDQARIDAFAETTEDRQFIHVDPERARATPFGGTIAHGFLTLSLLSRLAAGSVLILDGVKMGVNYGFDRVRFVAPVRAGARIRGRFRLDAAGETAPGRWRFRYAVTVEIEGEEKPALTADWLTMQAV